MGMTQNTNTTRGLFGGDQKIVLGMCSNTTCRKGLRMSNIMGIILWFSKLTE